MTPRFSSRSAAVVSACCAFFLLVPGAVAKQATATISFTGAPQTWIVPANATQAVFSLYGAQGGGGAYGPLAGGAGGKTTIPRAVTPGQSFVFRVGGKGVDTAFQATEPGGYNGGGDGSTNHYGGGGRTDVSFGGTVFAIAGGGGAGGSCAPSEGSTIGGAGGGANGGAGAQSAPTCAGLGGTPGQGGTQTAPGAGFASGVGSRGGDATDGSGGGGGYFGGGASQGNSAAGGGSSWPTTAILESGVQIGDGQATVSYNQPNLITVNAVGTGHGVVTASTGAFDCGLNQPLRTDCTETVADGTTINLFATAASETDFVGWSGGNCPSGAGNPICPITVFDDTAITATFALKQRTLSIDTAGAGAGYVTSQPAGIDCGRNVGGHAACSKTVASGTTVTLTAHPDSASTFAGFGGTCPASSLTCDVTVNAATQLTATFAKAQRIVTVNGAGTGSGYVTSTPAGIDCGRAAAGHVTCATTVDDGSSLTLTAHPNANTDFVGFSGAGCSGASATCTVTANGAQTVTATYVLKQRTITVQPTGNGAGTVTSQPAGIDCSADGTHAACSLEVADGTSVVLAAHPATDTDFGGFTGGGCAANSATCTVTADAARTVSATFTRKQRTVTVEQVGEGAVTSDVGGVACPADCGAVVDQGTTLTLTATAAPGYRFAGFTSADCVVAGATCTVTAGDHDVTVTATFLAPTIATAPATELSARSATLHGSIDPRGAAVNWAFRYFSDPAVQTTLPTATIPAGAGATEVSSALTGLAPDTIYTFQLVVQASGGEFVSGSRTFRTAPAPVPTPTATPSPAPSPTPTASPTPTPAPSATAAPVVPPAQTQTTTAAAALSLGLAQQGLVIDRTVSIGCKVAGASVKTCRITLKTAAGTLLGSGSGTTSVKVRLTAAGVARVALKPGGLSVVALGSATTADGGVVVGNARTKLVIQHRRIVSVRNTFAGFGSKPTARGAHSLRSLAAQLKTAGVRAVTCTGYAASVVGPEETRASVRLSRARAAAACEVLRDAGLNVRYVVVGAGKTRPVASNRTNAGRALNRRVEITVTYDA